MRLFCRRLTLANFRNHAALDLELDDRPVCLFGPNGAGKTNILEALTMLAPGRGLRGASLVEMARGGAPASEQRLRLWTVSARMAVDGEERMLGAAAERGEAGAKRIVRLDGQPASAAELARAARMSWLTPSMDRLFAGPAADRRRFLDRLVLARAPEHGVAALGYERALRERQRLLNQGGADPAWLNALEREMALNGAAMAAARTETLTVLRDAIETRPPVDGFPRAALALEGELEAAFAGGATSADVEDDVRRRLRNDRVRDAASGRTQLGPHRSDLLTRHAEKDMPADQCSTGEQKALLLGLVLAHAQAMADDPVGGPCLLLLDEAAAHLDPQRRAALYEALLRLGGQSWLTGTEAGLFEAFGGRAVLAPIGAN